MSPSVQQTETATLRLARSYKALGWSVVPVRPGGKLPAVSWAKYEREPANDKALVDWFSVGGYGIGLVQGSVSNTIVLDFDGQTGHDTLRDLEATYGELPPTVRALTPGGGLHFLLRHPGRRVPTRKNVLPGMDVRGDGGFIVAHPSIHANGRRYEWDCDYHPEDMTIADAPPWVVDLVCGDVTADSAQTAVIHTLRSSSLGMTEEVVTDGREAYMRDTILAVLREMRDDLRRLPSAEELFDSVWPQYSRKVDFSRPGRGADEVKRKCEYTLKRVSSGLVRGIDAQPAAQVEAHAEQVEHIDPETGEIKQIVKPAKEAPKIRLLSIADIEAMEDPQWMVDGLVPEKSLVVPYGPPKKGKTFIGLSMGLHIAANMDWAGKKVVGGGVIYIAGEGVGGLKLRLKAMRSHYGISDRIPFFFITKAVNFSQPGIVAELVQAIRDHVLDEPISLVVIDTLARAMPGVDENSSQEIGLVIAACDELKDALDCAVMPIHHTGKDADKGMRGSSAILGAVDAAFLVNSTGSTLTLTPTAQKDAELGPPIVFDMVTVPVGIGRTSLVPVLKEGPSSEDFNPQAPRLSGTESIALRALLNAQTDHGCMLGTWGESKGIPDIRVCKDEKWREAFRNLNPAENDESVSRAFRRVVKSLIDKKLVGACAPYVWSNQDV